MSTTVVVFAWIGLALGLVVALVVVWLFGQIPTRSLGRCDNCRTWLDHSALKIET